VSASAWADVDAYLAGLLVRDAPVVESGLPPADVSPLQGRLLEVLARAVGARRVLELGTLAGYSTIWLARSGAEVVSLELSEDFARVARANVERAGYGRVVEIVVGPALATLPALEGPFDLVFVDADKANNAAYLEHALRLSRPGTLIVADNVVRRGTVVEGDDESARGVRRFFELVAEEPRVVATALQTVGSKGWDGFALAVVTR
jgi:predicted O-methyltransferase YrrM